MIYIVHSYHAPYTSLIRDVISQSCMYESALPVCSVAMRQRSRGVCAFRRKRPQRRWTLLPVRHEQTRHMARLQGLVRGERQCTGDHHEQKCLGWILQSAVCMSLTTIYTQVKNAKQSLAKKTIWIPNSVVTIKKMGTRISRSIQMWVLIKNLSDEVHYF